MNKGNLFNPSQAFVREPWGPVGLPLVTKLNFLPCIASWWQVAGHEERTQPSSTCFHVDFFSNYMEGEQRPVAEAEDLRQSSAQGGHGELLSWEASGERSHTGHCC